MVIRGGNGRKEDRFDRFGSLYLEPSNWDGCRSFINVALFDHRNIIVMLIYFDLLVLLFIFSILFFFQKKESSILENGAEEDVCSMKYEEWKKLC